MTVTRPRPDTTRSTAPVATDPRVFRRRRVIAAAIVVLAIAIVVIVVSTIALAVSGSPAPKPGAGADAGAAASSGGAPAAPADPSVASISPATGSLVAGETVTISGADLDDVTRVTIGGVEATNVTVTDSEHVTATVPRSAAYVAGAVPVAVFAGDAAVPSSAAISYDYEPVTAVDRQLQYAFQHWNNYAPEYGNFNPSGGDCMNFVSQTLLARGWTMSANWFNKNGSHSSPWVYVPAFEDWLWSHPEIGATKLSLDQRDQVKIGDLVMMDWNPPTDLNHIQVVSDVVHNADGTISIKMVGHNIDTDFRDLDETITVDHPGMSAYFVSLPAA